MIIKKMSELQKSNLEMMIAFDKFAKQNGIDYYIAYGALIGAVRHHGFIPWDDDIDIMMTYPNFIKLCSCENLKESDLLLELPGENDTFFDFTPHICYPKYSVQRKTDNKMVNLYMDVFILSNIESGFKHKIRDIRLLLLYAEARGHRNFEKEIDMNSETNFIVSGAVKLIESIGRRKSLEKIIKKYFYIGDKNKDGHRYYICNNVPSELHEDYEKEWFRSVTYLNISGYDFPAPCGFDELLKVTYGDYMQLPPESERKPDHFIVTLDKIDN